MSTRNRLAQVEKIAGDALQKANAIGEIINPSLVNPTTEAYLDSFWGF